jgi:hypothetical protein
VLKINKLGEYEMCRVSTFALLCFGFLSMCGTVDAQKEYASHAPLRLNPPPSKRAMGKGPALFVDASKGDDENDGSIDSPWKTAAHAIKQLHPGDTLYLRGGSYFENVYVSLVGTPKKPIVIRSYPGEQAVIDGGIPDFQLASESAWEPVGNRAAGEYRSTKAYPNIRDVIGAFGDSDVGLQTYWHLKDLRSPHELSAPGEGGDVRAQYCGPGIYYDRITSRIHLRMAHTTFKHFVNYQGEQDPRKLPLVIAPFRSIPLWVDQAKHVKFQDLIIRGGGYYTTQVTYGVDVDFDNVTIRGGTYCMRTANTGPFRFYRSAMYGNAPPWAFRGDGSLRARPGRPTRDIARLTCHALWITDTGREFSVYAFPMNDNWEVSYSEFTDSHDGPYLGGVGVKFHHNLVDFFQDDGIYLSQMYPRHLYNGNGARIEIYENLFTRSLTPLAFGGLEGTADDIYIYRNIFDLRGGVNYGRPSEKNPDVKPHPTLRALADHGGPTWPKMSIYHNTFVTLGGKIGLGTMGHVRPGHPRSVFNNVFYNFGGMGRIKPPSHELGQSDGNLFWSPKGQQAAATYFSRYRNSPAFAASKSVYPAGFTSNSLATDPQFTKVSPSWPDQLDLRLQKNSPAINAGATLPNTWPDSKRKEGDARPDIGALPFGSKPFAVGRTALE